MPQDTNDTASAEIVRDDLICGLVYYEGYGSEAKSDDKEQLPQSCSRSEDGLTVYVTTYSTSEDKHAPTVDDLVELTDEAYEAAE